MYGFSTGFDIIMNIKDQVIRIITQRARYVFPTLAAGALALAIPLSLVKANAEDHIVIVRQSQSLEQIVEDELQSSRFAKQIATYNGIDSISTILPGGTSLQIPQPYMQSRQFGRVVFSKGDVTHSQRRLVVNPPARGAFVYNGDTFTTGGDGFVSLSFSSGAVVNLQPESRVSIANIECADETVDCVIALSAEQGEVSSEITPRPDGQPAVKFSVKTPFLSAAVRGTAFYVTVDDNEDRLGVTHGLVAADVNGTANEIPEGKGLLAKAGVDPAEVNLLAPPELAVGTEKTIYSSQDELLWQAQSGAEQYRLMIAQDESMSQPIFVENLTSNSAALPVETPGSYYLSVAGIDDKMFVGLPASAFFSYASIDDQEKLELQIERSSDVVDVVDIVAPSHTGAVELLISQSIDDSFAERRIIDDLSGGISLDLSPQEDWVFQARKILSDTSVSVYSNQYLLEANR